MRDGAARPFAERFEMASKIHALCVLAAASVIVTACATSPGEGHDADASPMVDPAMEPGGLGEGGGALGETTGPIGGGGEGGSGGGGSNIVCNEEECQDLDGHPPSSGEPEDPGVVCTITDPDGEGGAGPIEECAPVACDLRRVDVWKGYFMPRESALKYAKEQCDTECMAFDCACDYETLADYERAADGWYYATGTRNQVIHKPKPTWNIRQGKAACK